MMSTIQQIKGPFFYINLEPSQNLIILTGKKKVRKEWHVNQKTT